LKKGLLRKAGSVDVNHARGKPIRMPGAAPASAHGPEADALIKHLLPKAVPSSPASSAHPRGRHGRAGKAP
jgi:hypothetical protein